MPQTPENSPTPAEIRERCEVIQAEWTSKERERRTAPAYRRVRWMPQGTHATPAISATAGNQL